MVRMSLNDAMPRCALCRPVVSSRVVFQAGARDSGSYRGLCAWMQSANIDAPVVAVIAGCFYSTALSQSCRSMNGESKCEIIKKIFRQCPGQNKVRTAVFTLFLNQRMAEVVTNRYTCGHEPTAGADFESQGNHRGRTWGRALCG